MRLGYRHVDTAQGYDNETAVGDGIKASRVPRDRIFITTKVRPDFATDGPLQRSAEDSLKRLRIDVVDLLLLHWPSADVRSGPSRVQERDGADEAGRAFLDLVWEARDPEAVDRKLVEVGQFLHLSVADASTPTAARAPEATLRL